MYEATFCFDAFQLCVMVIIALLRAPMVFHNLQSTHICCRFRTSPTLKLGHARHGKPHAHLQDPMALPHEHSRCTGQTQEPIVWLVRRREYLLVALSRTERAL